jgi:hypothetical protein
MPFGTNPRTYNPETVRHCNKEECGIDFFNIDGNNKPYCQYEKRSKNYDIKVDDICLYLLQKKDEKKF